MPRPENVSRIKAATPIALSSRARGSGNAQLAPERYLLAALLVAGKELPARKRHRVHGAHFEAQRKRRLGQGRERQQRGERESYRLSHVILLPRSLREPHPCELPRIPMSAPAVSKTCRPRTWLIFP